MLQPTTTADIYDVACRKHDHMLKKAHKNQLLYKCDFPSIVNQFKFCSAAKPIRKWARSNVPHCRQHVG